MRLQVSSHLERESNSKVKRRASKARLLQSNCFGEIYCGGVLFPVGGGGGVAPFGFGFEPEGGCPVVPGVGELGLVVDGFWPFGVVVLGAVVFGDVVPGAVPFGAVVPGVVLPGGVVPGVVVFGVVPGVDGVLGVV